MNYRECCSYLINKYDHPPRDYFRNKKCKSKPPENSRTKEGLVIHHIDEDKAILLSSKQCAVTMPFNYQRKERLVYCNYLEHLILHLKIIEYPNSKANDELLGARGVFYFILPDINKFFVLLGIKEIEKLPLWQKNCANKIKNNFREYLLIWKQMFNLKQGGWRKIKVILTIVLEINKDFLKKKELKKASKFLKKLKTNGEKINITHKDLESLFWTISFYVHSNLKPTKEMLVEMIKKIDKSIKNIAKAN